MSGLFVVQVIAHNRYPRIEGGIQSYNNPEIVPVKPYYWGHDGQATDSLSEAMQIRSDSTWYKWAKADPKHYNVLAVGIVLLGDTNVSTD